VANGYEALLRVEEAYQKLLEEHIKELSSLQQLHYASNRYALLLIFQALDAAGKDGAIRHVMSGVNPEGCDVFSFKQPSAEELEHDFSGARRAGFRNAGESASSIVPTMRRCLSFACIRRFSAPKDFRMNCSTRRLF